MAYTSVIANGGFESGNFTSWDVSNQGGGSNALATASYNGKSPQAGSYFAVFQYASSADAYYVFQDCDASAYATEIDAGDAICRAGGYGIQAEAGYDQYHIKVIYLDTDRAVVSTPYDSGWQTDAGWTQRGIVDNAIPVNTRYIRIWRSCQETGGYDAGGVDSIYCDIDPTAAGGGADTAKKRMSATHLLVPSFPMAILPD